MDITCVIDFENNPAKFFYSGQTMNGNIQLNLAREKKVRGVYIKFSGKGRVKWHQGKTNYKAKEVYFEDREYFIGGANGKSDINSLCLGEKKNNGNVILYVFGF